MNILIFGLGLHGGGLGVANYFIKKGYDVTITDLKSEDKLKNSIEKLYNKEKVKLTLGRHDYKDIDRSDLIIKNPAVPPDSPYIQYAEKRSKPIETDIGIFLEIIKEKTGNIIGVTGTRGKSTTATLIYSILKNKYKNCVLAGNITVSVFDVIDEIKNDSWVILELSSFQLGGIRRKNYSPPYSVITNLYNDHLNYYKNIHKYFDDKKVIYRFQKPGDTLILNRENIVYEMVKPNPNVNIYSFGFNQYFNGNGSFIKNNKIYIKKGEKTSELMPCELIKLKGRHNLLNVMAAACLASSIGIDKSIIKNAITKFKGLEHRLEKLGVIRGLEVYNDSASTTPEALINALETFKGRNITLIMGGTDKILPLENLIKVINLNKDIRNLLFLKGSGTERLIKGGITRDFKIFDSLEKAVNEAFKISEPNSILLFSPAFASFELFKNEFDRGNKFKELINSHL